MYKKGNRNRMKTNEKKSKKKKDGKRKTDEENEKITDAMSVYFVSGKIFPRCKIKSKKRE